MSCPRTTLLVAALALALAGRAAAAATPATGTIGQSPASMPPGSVQQGPPGAPPPLGAPNGVPVHPGRMTTLPGAVPGPPPPQRLGDPTPPAPVP